jgi:dihydroorotase-like cyclic amidohydrolase
MGAYSPGAVHTKPIEENACVTHELVIRGGNVVTPGHQEVADIGIRDGRIDQIGGETTGATELDARGLLVIPGGIDAHVHLVTAALRAAGRSRAGRGS